MRVELSYSVVALVVLAGCASAPEQPTAIAHWRFVRAEPAVAPEPQVLPEEIALEREWPEPEYGPIVIKGGFVPAPESAEQRAVRLKAEQITRWVKASEGQYHGPPPREAINCAETTTPAPDVSPQLAVGPHIRALGRSDQKIGLFGSPGVQMIYLIDQGAPCEILGSERYAGTTWYLVRARGAEGWTPLVDAD